MHQHLGDGDGGEGVHDHWPPLPPSEHLHQVCVPESKVEREKGSKGEGEEGEGALEVSRAGGEEEQLFSKPGPGKDLGLKWGPGWRDGREQRQEMEDLLKLLTEHSSVPADVGLALSQ